MATTPKGIYYPNDYNEIADIPEDMKKMAESIDEVFEDTDSDLSDIKEEQTTQNNRLNSLETDNTTNKSDILTNKQEINNIKTEQTEQNTNILTNATNIESLQEENENLKKIVSQLPQVEGQGTEVTLENTIEAQFTKFDVEGNSTQDGTRSPDNEVPIYSAGDNGSINEKIQTRNLFVANKSGTYTINGITFKTNGDGSVSVNGTSTGYIYAYVEENDGYINTINATDASLMTIPANTPFTLSGSTSNVKLRLRNQTDKTNDSDGDITKTYNAEKQIAVMFYIMPNKTINETLYPMVEYGSTATPYVPHQEQDYSIFVQQPFRSIGDVRDCFVKKSDGWYERHYIGEVVLDGSETAWTKSGNTTVDRFIINTNLYLNDTNSKCNYFKTGTLNNTNKGQWYNNLGVQLVFNYANPGTTTLAQWKEWLSTHNLTLIQPLAEPLDLPCTQNQIDVLENLPSTYKDFTIIQSEDETPAYLEVSGIYDMNKLITRTEVLESEV